MTATANGRLPGSRADREHQSFALDRDGIASRRVTDLQQDDVIDRLDSILEALQAIRLGIGILNNEEV